MTPETRYARTADGTHVAYQVHGEGPIDIVVLRAFYSNLDHDWEEPIWSGIFRRLGSIGRVIRLDRRGSGLSDRLDHSVVPTLEDRVDDIQAVMRAAGSERAVLFGIGHAAALFCVFAASHPDRTVALVIWSPPLSIVHRYDEDFVDDRVAEARAGWGTQAYAAEFVRIGAPSRADEEALVAWTREDQRLSGTPDEAAALYRLALETSVTDILPTIHVPTLICWRADASSASVEAAATMAAAVPGAVGRSLPGEDMFLLAGDWHRGIREIEDFIVSVAGNETDADRVLTTVMFTDVVGSTERAAELGDRAWRDLVQRHHTSIRRELARHRGREVDTAGDGFFAAFDGPARAIRCASAIRSAIGALGLEVRIGLHTGECERVGAGLRGVAVHIGARVGAAAPPGEVLVTSTVRDLVAGSGIRFEDVGRHELKGLPDSWHLFRVTDV